MNENRPSSDSSSRASTYYEKIVGQRFETTLSTYFVRFPLPKKSMKEVQPILDPNGVYSGKRTCAELGVSYKTLQKYRENGYIRQHNPENTTRPRYTGKSIMDCWKKVSAL